MHRYARVVWATRRRAYFSIAWRMTADGHYRESSTWLLMRTKLPTFGMSYRSTEKLYLRKRDQRAFGRQCVFRVIAALYPAKRHVDRKWSYLHYTTVLNLANIRISDNVQRHSKIRTIERGVDQCIWYWKWQVLLLQLTDNKKEKHVNLLYLQDSRRQH